MSYQSLTNSLYNPSATVGTSGTTLVLSDTTQSTSKDTGALIVEGGAGIEKNTYIGGDLNVTGSITGGSISGGSTGTTGQSTVGTSETTTGTFPQSLATAQAVTVTTGTKALVCVSARSSGTAAGQELRFGFAVSGATTIGATSNPSVGWDVEVTATNKTRQSGCFLVDSLTAGSNTFTMQFGISSGTGTFSDREISVINLN